MHISVGAVSYQILLLGAIRAAVVGPEFQVIRSQFKGRLALDDFVTTLPRCLISDGNCLKQSPLVMVNRAKRVRPDTLILILFTVYSCHRMPIVTIITRRLWINGCQLLER